ncbi:MAG TPA: MSMEG_0570 family nitrogen starvation response protein, partial [Haloferula sp.]
RRNPPAPPDLMPETPFTVELPDGSLKYCYSPSSVVRDYFVAGDTLPADEFLRKARASLSEASNRVLAKFGFACSSAASSLEEIEHWASALPPESTVRIHSI